MYGLFVYSIIFVRAFLKGGVSFTSLVNMVFIYNLVFLCTHHVLPSLGLNTKPNDAVLSHPALHEALNDPKNGNSAHKHLKQQVMTHFTKLSEKTSALNYNLFLYQASLLGNLEDLGLLGPARCYVEFGAGKGKLSHWIHVALQDAQNVHFLLVERCSTRFKVEHVVVVIRIGGVVMGIVFHH